MTRAILDDHEPKRESISETSGLVPLFGNGRPVPGLAMENVVTPPPPPFAGELRDEAGLLTNSGPEINLRDIFASAPLGIFQSTKRRLMNANPALARMFGYASPAEMVASLDDSRGFFANPAVRDEIVRVVLESQTYVKREVQYRRKDGSVFIAQLYMRAVRGESGVLFEGFVEDITEHRQLEEEFRHAQKMEAIGQLAGGVAHDFNNILAATLLHLSLLQDDPQLTPGTRESLKEVEAETQRAVGLTRQLLLFGRRQVARIEPLDLNALVKELLKMLRRLLGENIQVKFDRAPVGAPLKADAGMLEQVVMNLCINARDAMPRGGQLTLSAAVIDLAGYPVKGQAEARSGRFVCLSVQDSGCGMDQAVLKHLFEPFFTTKPVGKGTGLGLATVFGIVKQHDGWIEVESVVGQGSTFRVYLPGLATPADQPQAAETGGEPVRGGSETILLVEDDFSLRRASALCLRKRGYAVLEAAHGAEALELWRKHQPRVDLLFTDMVMPQTMTGLDLAKRLRKERPGLGVIISSGYTAEQADLVSPELGMKFLAKPYHFPNLAKLVRQCLDEAQRNSTPPGARSSCHP